MWKVNISQSDDSAHQVAPRNLQQSSESQSLDGGLESYQMCSGVLWRVSAMGLSVAGNESSPLAGQVLSVVLRTVRNSQFIFSYTSL